MSFGIFNQIVVETAVLAVLGLVVAMILRGRVDWTWFAASIVFFLAHKAVLFLGLLDGVLPELIGGRYNWEGKIAGTGFSLVFAFIFLRNSRAEWGFTLRQTGPAVRWGWIFAALVAVANAAFVLWYWPGTNSAELADWTYQLTMPSLDEELVYRGILLLMLERAFRPTLNLIGVPVGWGALLTILIFYVSHALRVDADWNVAFIAGEILPLIYASFWVYVRAATGSLLAPVLLHSWANTAGYIL